MLMLILEIKVNVTIIQYIVGRCVFASVAGLVSRKLLPRMGDVQNLVRHLRLPVRVLNCAIFMTR
jgi:hypothetical protein